MQYVYQTHHVRRDKNGNNHYAVVLYRSDYWETTRPDGKKVEACEYIPVGVIHGGHELRDDARRWFAGTWGELPKVSGQIPGMHAKVPVVHHRDVFHLFGEPAHVLIAQMGYPLVNS